LINKSIQGYCFVLWWRWIIFIPL